MGVLNLTGYQTTTLSEKITALENVFKSAFGPDINLDTYSPQGQLITYIATVIDNADKVGLDFFNNLDYHNASGEMLSLIALTKGQPRRDGTQAYLTVTLTSSASGYTIPANSLFTTLDGTITFKNEVDIAVTALTQSANLISVEKVETSIIVTDNLTSVSYFASLTDIEVSAVTEGTGVESDSALIQRLDNSDSQSSVNDYRSIITRVNLIDNVSRVALLENTTDAPVDAVPAHGIEVQVVGGEDDAIAQTIFDNKATGTPTSGNVTNLVLDIQGYSKTIYFNRPTLKTIYVQVTLAKRNGVAVDTSRFTFLQDSTQQYINNLKIGDDVSWTQIFGIWGTQNFNIDTLELGFDGITYVETDLTIGKREYAEMANTNQINIIVLP